MSHLRQIGIALSLYHDRIGSLPPGRIKGYDPRFTSPIPGCTTTFIDKSFLVSILPEIEQSNLYNSINQNLSIFCLENTTCHTTSVSIFACPSDPLSGFARDIPFNRLAGAGVVDLPDQRHQMVSTSYTGMTGMLEVPALPSPGLNCQGDPACLAQNNGVFCDASPINYASISDGLSQTVFVTEHATTPWQSIKQPVKRLPFQLYGWYVSGNFGCTLSTSFYPINSYKFLPASATDAVVNSASSLHPGGVNLLMGDGSVRFVLERIDSWPSDRTSGNPTGAVPLPNGTWQNLPPSGVWQAITTRSNGELIGLDDF